MAKFLTWLWKNKGAVYTAGSIAWELGKKLVEKLKSKKTDETRN